MGLVQSQTDSTDQAVQVDDFWFTIEQRLEHLIPIYGPLVIDFHNAFWGENFSVRFSRQGSC